MMPPCPGSARSSIAPAEAGCRMTAQSLTSLIMASTLTVRLFELLCLSLWVGGLVWVRRVGHPVYAGVYLGSTLLFGWDWIFNSNWFFRVEFDPKFIDVWRIQGVSEPLAMALNYASYFGAPVLLL